MSISSNLFFTASYISSVLSTLHTSSNMLGIFIDTLPHTKYTLAPLLFATFPISYPILPDELFVINLTGSIASFVPPKVTSIFFPSRSLFVVSSSTIVLIITSTFSSLPTPVVLHANLPLAGPMNSTPIFASFLTFS